MQFKMQLQLPHPMTVFALVIGGIHPLSLVRSHLHLIDRNVLSKLRSNQQQLCAADQFWLGGLDHQDILINPVLCAFEGKFRQTPTFTDFSDELVSARKKLVELLPNARVVEHSSASHLQLYQNIKDTNQRYEQEVEFLLQTAPLVFQREKDEKLSSLQSTIVGSAKHFGIAGRSLSLLAVLSCLYERKDGSEPAPGRLVIKPRPDYGEQDAHNSISDLRSLEFLVAGAAYGFGPTALCTKDRGLALFWQALKLHTANGEANSVSYKYTLTTELLPRLPDNKLEQLAQEISAD